MEEGLVIANFNITLDGVCANTCKQNHLIVGLCGIGLYVVFEWNGNYF